MPFKALTFEVYHELFSKFSFPFPVFFFSSDTPASFKSYQRTTSPNVVKQFSPSQKFIAVVKPNKIFYLSKLIVFVYDFLLLAIYQDCFSSVSQDRLQLFRHNEVKKEQELKLKRLIEISNSKLSCFFCPSALSKINVMIRQKGLEATGRLFFMLRIFASSSWFHPDKNLISSRIDFPYVVIT